MTFTRTPRWRRLLAAIVLVLLVAAGCSTGDDDNETAATDDSGAESFQKVQDGLANGDADDGGDDGGADDTVAADEPEDAAADAEVAQNDGAGGDAGSTDTPSSLTPADLGRSIIYVASTEVEVEDVALAASQAKTAIAGLGGLVFGENTESGETNRTTLEFKVLPEDFQEALNRLEGLGDLQSQTITADDVTERVVDLSSRISTAEISVIRLRDLLALQTDLADIAQLEQQLVERETDLELLRGQLRTLEDQVDLATIFLTLREPAPPQLVAFGEYEVTFYPGSDGGDRCPGAGDLEIDEGEDFTVCVAITNVGNTAFGEIEVRDHGLDLDRRDFQFINADRDVVLQPGESVLAWASDAAGASGTSSVSIGAVAVDADGDQLRVNSEFENISDDSLRFIEDTSLPGFMDALTGSWEVLLGLVGIAVLIAAATIPFIWVPFAIYFGRRWWLSRKPAPPAMPPSSQPPSPAPEPVAGE